MQSPKHKTINVGEIAVEWQSGQFNAGAAAQINVCSLDGCKNIGLKWTMNGLQRSFKKSNPKNRKTVKNPSEIAAACEQKKTSSQKANFLQTNTVFSLI